MVAGDLDFSVSLADCSRFRVARVQSLKVRRITSANLVFAHWIFEYGYEDADHADPPRVSLCDKYWNNWRNWGVEV